MDDVVGFDDKWVKVIVKIDLYMRKRKLRLSGAIAT